MWSRRGLLVAGLLVGVIVIVGATFIAGLIVGAQRDDANGPVDLIIVNGKVYPGGGKQFQEAVAVRREDPYRIVRLADGTDISCYAVILATLILQGTTLPMLIRVLGVEVQNGSMLTVNPADRSCSCHASH